jgi:hypothetical protein
VCQHWQSDLKSPVRLCTRDGFVCLGFLSFILEIVMTHPSTLEILEPSLHVLASTLTNLSEIYQQLLRQPDSLAFCKEAGRSLRSLSDHYAQVLIAAIPQEDSEDEDDETSFDDEDDDSYLGA